MTKKIALNVFEKCAKRKVVSEARLTINQQIVNYQQVTNLQLFSVCLNRVQ